MLPLYLSYPDEELDKQDFEKIYRKYHDDIYRRSYHMLRNKEDVNEAMQETWMGVLQKLPVLRGRDEVFVKSYIMSIARNQSIAVLRRKKKDSAVFSDTELVESEKLVDDEDLFAVCEEEGISRVLECINMLSNSQREVIMMYYLHHRSIKEIAALFNISESVAESRWNHGRQRLKELLIRRGIYVQKNKNGT
jgi:RNA polymerase sigma-70 factor (ECF subfamily)